MNYSFIAIGDMHLGCKLYNLSELETDMKLLFSDICQIAIDKKVNYLLITGDLFHHNKPTPDLISFVAEKVALMKSHNITTVGICGDHDAPVNEKTWVAVTGIVSPVPATSNIPYFVGVDYGIDQQKIMDEVIKMASPDVHWILLHGQVQQLFEFVEEKKRLDFSKVNIFGSFPNIKGIILGDIHNGEEMTLRNGSKEIFMGYCGSPGITKSDEISNKKGLLYFDGDKISRVPLLQKRDYIKIKFLGEVPVLNTQFYVMKYEGVKNKPVFIIEYDTASEKMLGLLKPLYEVGFVRTTQIRKIGDNETEETINIRSELKTTDRIQAVLRKCVKNENVFDLAFQLLTSDKDNNDTYKEILDAFEQKSLQ